uniref:Uncharacterized protein n=1 Tax=Electrophorus electricus TaxID=8005 RepID=A0A4W4DVV0_ELEEL
ISLQAQCKSQCTDCCPSVSPFEYCYLCAQSCDCRPPTLNSCLDYCPSPSFIASSPLMQCVRWDCTCTCQPPQCDSLNCLCFEINFK